MRGLEELVLGVELGLQLGSETSKRLEFVLQVLAALVAEEDAGVAEEVAVEVVLGHKEL